MAKAWRLRLRFSLKAEHQLTAIARYIGEDSPAAAARTVRAIQSAARFLVDFPETGRSGSVPATREWIVHGLPYIIVYRVDAEAHEVAVIEIVHGARRR